MGGEEGRPLLGPFGLDDWRPLPALPHVISGKTRMIWVVYPVVKRLIKKRTKGRISLVQGKWRKKLIILVTFIGLKILKCTL